LLGAHYKSYSLAKEWKRALNIVSREKGTVPKVICIVLKPPTVLKLFTAAFPAYMLILAEAAWATFAYDMSLES
jgi:hypothetical protein